MKEGAWADCMDGRAIGECSNGTERRVTDARLKLVTFRMAWRLVHASHAMGRAA